MRDTHKVTYENLSASIKYHPSDGLFHAYWNIGGIKGKAAYKTIQGAEAIKTYMEPVGGTLSEQTSGTFRSTYR